jgi:predicted oxidoreductase
MTFSKLIAGTMKWGAWGAKLTLAGYEHIINTCIEQGITTFDHADIYGDYTTEAEFGEVLQKNPALRSKMQLVTKCGIQKVSSNRPHFLIKSYNTSAEHLIQSVETSLKNLHTDFIDLLLIHRPDVLMDADEIAKAVNQLQEQGKIIDFGVSNFKRWQVDLLKSRLPIKANQIECSITHLDPFHDGTLDQCQQHHMIPMAWSPLGGGNLFIDIENERSKRILAVAGLLAETYSTTPDIILLNWLLAHPSGIHPVLGTANSERIKKVKASLSFQLSREEWYMLWRASAGKEVA